MSDEYSQTRRQTLRNISKTGSAPVAGSIAGCSGTSDTDTETREPEEEVTNYVEDVELEDLPNTAEVGDKINLEGYAVGDNLSSLTFQYREVGNEVYNNIHTKSGSGSQLRGETDFTAQDAGRYEFRVLADSEGSTEDENHSRVSSSQIVEYLKE